MSTALRLVLRDNGDPARLIAIGHINAGTVGNFEAALDHATTRHHDLVVDLTGVESLGDQGLDALNARIRHVKAVLVSTQSPVGGKLEIRGLGPWMARRPAVDQIRRNRLFGKVALPAALV